MPYATMSDNTSIYYNDWGSGTPVVLIHGWPATSAMWEKQSTYLAEHGLRVITYDRRGCGRSSQPWNGYDYDTLASDLHALIEGLDLTGATLVGFSMGGGEVVRYLSRYGSSRVKSAVLLAAVTPYLLKTDDNPTGVDAKVFEGIEEQIRKDRPAFLKEFLPKFYGRSVIHHTVSDEALAFTREICMSASLRATLAEAVSWSSTDFRNDLRSIQIPVRVIHGTSDATVPIDASARESVKHLPNATLTEYDGEPHGLFLTAADRLNDELLHFIGGSREPITASVECLIQRSSSPANAWRSDQCSDAFWFSPWLSGICGEFWVPCLFLPAVWVFRCFPGARRCVKWWATCGPKRGKRGESMDTVEVGNFPGYRCSIIGQWHLEVNLLGPTTSGRMLEHGSSAR